MKRTARFLVLIILHLSMAYGQAGYGYSEPFYLYDGKKLFFLSGKVGASGNAENEKINFVERQGDGWSEPDLLDPVFDPFKIQEMLQ